MTENELHGAASVQLPELTPLLLKYTYVRVIHAGKSTKDSVDGEPM
jgi:hypothetical protein